MALIKWNDGLSVNIHEIDEQHKMLTEKINQFHEVLTEKESKEAMDSLFYDLIQYSATHFATEERYFDLYSYPDSVAHRREHDYLTMNVNELRQRYDDGEDVLSVEVTAFLGSWLKDHILDTDMKYSDFLNSKGAK